jgi:hypothetical protein
VSNIYDAPMPWMLRLTNDGVSIHGSKVERGYATNGCVGVPDAFAKRLFKVAKVGDKVIITDGKRLGLGDPIIASGAPGRALEGRLLPIPSGPHTIRSLAQPGAQLVERLGLQLVDARHRDFQHLRDFGKVQLFDEIELDHQSAAVPARRRWRADQMAAFLVGQQGEASGGRRQRPSLSE